MEHLILTLGKKMSAIIYKTEEMHLSCIWSHSHRLPGQRLTAFQGTLLLVKLFLERIQPV